MTTDVYLFTSPTCPHCPRAKRFIESYREERDDFTLHAMDATNPDSKEYAQRFGVQSVPTFVIVGEGYEQPVGVTGTPSEEHFGKLLDLAQGKISEDALR